jgi:hypothetical protein
VRRSKTTGRAPVTPIFEVRPLDPAARCGPGTTVRRLYRVTEHVAGTRHLHLVFLDRHGWYCEHGRACPAVKEAQDFDGKPARHGRTHNARMRA